MAKEAGIILVGDLIPNLLKKGAINNIQCSIFWPMNIENPGWRIACRGSFLI
jgi:hypothetical protein